jgi:hypothetical protein
MTQTHTAQRPGRSQSAPKERTSGRGWDATLDGYHRAAAAALDTHLNHGGHCTSCGQSWPCSRALAAAFALDL